MPPKRATVRFPATHNAVAAPPVNPIEAAPAAIAGPARTIVAVAPAAPNPHFNNPLGVKDCFNLCLSFPNHVFASRTSFDFSGNLFFRLHF